MQCYGQRFRDWVRVTATATLMLLTLAGLPPALAQVCPFDDGNSTLAVDGLILTRYALGITGAPLVANTDINAVDAPTVEAHINCPSCGLNITGNPTLTVADATIISRKLAGFSGATLTNGLNLGSGSRNTPAAVNSFLLAGCGATGGTVTSITAGTGLTGGIITGSGTIDADTAFLQRRVALPCAAGSFITAIAADGTATCGAPPAGSSGTVTSVATGAGLTGGPISSSGTINLAATQLLPTVACAANTIAFWNGVFWSCDARPPSVPQSCLDGQLLKLVAGAIQCSAAPQTFTTVDSVGAVGQHMSIAKSLDGMPIISYFDSFNSSVKVIKCGNAACSGGNIVNTVDNSGSLGRFTAIAVPSNGFPVISYSSSNNPAETVASALKVAKCVDVSCTGAATLTVVDSSAVAVGRHSSMAISADGFPVISYYDGTNGTLKVAKCVNASCAGATITTLDGIAATDVGRFTSITVPVDGLPVISYLDVTNFDLKVVKCSVANCSTFNTPVTVDGAGASLVGEHTSIAKSADGFPIIAYFSNSTFALKVAKCINAGCTGATLVNPLSGGVQGSQLSIAVPADGLPVISHAVSGGGLRVVKCGNASCTSGNVFSTVDPVGINGAAILVPASDDLPVIAYDDRFNSDLKVVKCSNSGCANP